MSSDLIDAFLTLTGDGSQVLACSPNNMHLGMFNKAFVKKILDNMLLMCLCESGHFSVMMYLPQCNSHSKRIINFNSLSFGNELSPTQLLSIVKNQKVLGLKLLKPVTKSKPEDLVGLDIVSLPLPSKRKGGKNKNIKSIKNCSRRYC